MQRGNSKWRRIVPVALAAIAGLMLATQATEAAQRKVLFENFTASW